MTFESFLQAQSFFLWATFGIALLMGAVVNKTNFCTMGAVSDMVNMGDLGRFRAWLLAIAVVLGSALTMKVQYYKLVYEEEAGFTKALVASLADLHLLPNGLRRLDKV